LKNVFDSKPDIRKLYTNPISFAYEPHLGPVFSVEFNPFDRFFNFINTRNIFLSVSLDGNIRIYDLLSPKLLAFFDMQNQYLFKAMWSFTRSSVFTAASCNNLRIIISKWGCVYF
jgi:WD40 repeat protein